MKSLGSLILGDILREDANSSNVCTPFHFLDHLRIPDSLFVEEKPKCQVIMPQKCFQGMWFSVTSRTLNNYNDFDDVKNSNRKLLWWIIQQIFTEHLLYPKPHTKCWGYSKVIPFLLLMFSCSKTKGLRVFHLLLQLRRSTLLSSNLCPVGLTWMVYIREQPTVSHRPNLDQHQFLYGLRTKNGFCSFGWIKKK